MNCDLRLASCGPAAAWWRHRNGNTSRLCQKCLDHWFDNADDDETLEPDKPSADPRPSPEAHAHP